jgi:hypothetical protein
MNGVKHSKDKLPIFKVIFEQFPRSIKEVVRASNGGHKKYPEDLDWNNWQRVEDGQFEYRQAAVRHLMDSVNEVWNPDMKEFGGVRHLASAVWNLLAAMELDLIEEEKTTTDFKQETGKLIKQSLEDLRETFKTDKEMKRIASDPEKAYQEELERKMKEAMASQPYPWYEYGKNPYHNLDGTLPKFTAEEIEGIDKDWSADNSYDPFIHIKHPVRLSPDQFSYGTRSITNS